MKKGGTGLQAAGGWGGAVGWGWSGAYGGAAATVLAVAATTSAISRFEQRKALMGGRLGGQVWVYVGFR